MKMKRYLFGTAMAACLIGALLTTAAAEEPTGDITLTQETTGGNYTLSEAGTITVQGQVTLTGTGDAFTIGADTELVFEEGASLTLSGYTNGFVVEDDSAVTLTSSNMDITASTQMDVFRLRNNGQLSLSGDNTITGSGKEGTTNRAIVLEGNNAQNQAVTLAANSTLTANNFYRGLETGGAKNYTISGADMDSSTFDFSNNNCGMALSYFDQNANFKDCKLEVSNCDASGIFMRQDNAALDGLYLTRVNINCVNDIDLEQSDIAIRFHSNNFEITDCVINIENAWNTGMWIFDGWNANEQNEITGTDITVKNVMGRADTELYGTVLRSKAITVVPYRDWLISDCTITMEGTAEEDSTQGGLNIANDTQIIRQGLSVTAKPNMCGGTIILEDTEIYTNNLKQADIGVQVGQFVEVRQNVVIENDHDAENWNEHFTILCDSVYEKYPVRIGNLTLRVGYDTANMTEAQMTDDRVVTTGGSYWSSDRTDLQVAGIPAYAYSLPINASGDKLTLFTVTPTQYAAYFDSTGTISLADSNGNAYNYTAKAASSDGNRYIWAYAATVTFSNGETIKVPCGTPFGMFGTLPEGNWTLNGQPFTASTVVTGDITVTAQ